MIGIGLMSGTSDTTFSPDASMSRAMLTTVLYRLMGEPEPETAEAVFADVSAGSWYGPAVTWAWENDVINGYGGGLFGPADELTREQAAVILWRLLRNLGADVSMDEEDMPEFADAQHISGYARDALDWACGMGLLDVGEDGTADPKGVVTRGEAAQIVLNFIVIVSIIIAA